MGAIYDAESLAANATEEFQAGLWAPASQTSWLPALSSLFTKERERGGVPYHSVGTEGDVLAKEMKVVSSPVLISSHCPPPRALCLYRSSSPTPSLCRREKWLPERFAQCHTQSVTELELNLKPSACCLGLFAVPQPCSSVLFPMSLHFIHLRRFLSSTNVEMSLSASFHGLLQDKSWVLPAHTGCSMHVYWALHKRRLSLNSQYPSSPLHKALIYLHPLSCL